MGKQDLRWHLGSVTKTTTYYPAAGAMRVEEGTGNNVYYALKDHLGSASVMTDASGTVVGEQRYYPFGETRWSTGSMFTDKLYTGQREMAGLGIYHYGARFYSPKLGRFLSADTVVPGAGNPQAYNRYSYVLNNPLAYIDPSGHNPCRSDYLCGRREQKRKTKEETARLTKAGTVGTMVTMSAQPAAQPARNAMCDTFSCSDGVFTSGGSYSSGGVYGGFGGPRLPMPNQSSGSSNQNDVLKPPPFTQASSTASVSIPFFPPSPFACGWFDCALSAMSTIASGFTMTGAPEIAGPAVVVDLVATGIATVRTYVDYRQGEIGGIRALGLGVTGLGGLYPGPIGFGFSVINSIMTIFGFPYP